MMQVTLDSTLRELLSNHSQTWRSINVSGTTPCLVPHPWRHTSSQQTPKPDPFTNTNGTALWSGSGRYNRFSTSRVLHCLNMKVWWITLFLTFNFAFYFTIGVFSGLTLTTSETWCGLTIKCRGSLGRNYYVPLLMKMLLRTDHKSFRSIWGWRMWLAE